MVDQLTAVDALMASVNEEKRRLMNKSQAVSALCWIPGGGGVLGSSFAENFSRFQTARNLWTKKNEIP